VQEKIGVTPNYGVVSETGPDHDKTFVVAVYVKENEVGRGSGPSKQEGEIAAAQNALDQSSF
jgi:ribonuclease-3